MLLSKFRKFVQEMQDKKARKIRNIQAVQDVFVFYLFKLICIFIELPIDLTFALYSVLHGDLRSI